MVVPLNSKSSILIGCFIINFINYQFWGSPRETPNCDCFEQASAPWYPGSAGVNVAGVTEVAQIYEPDTVGASA